MLSRVADSLYWMARYIERAENLARMIDVNLQLLLDYQTLDAQFLEKYWLPLLKSTGDEELFSSTHGKRTSANITRFLTTDRVNPHSIISSVAKARENARMIRDQISEDTWEEINGLYLFLKSSEAERMREADAYTFYERIRKGSLLFQAIVDATTPQDEGWDFLQLGKFLERADKTTRMLDLTTYMTTSENQPLHGLDSLQWVAILRSCSAYPAYRTLYGSDVVPDSVAELLIFSKTFPRSIRFCLQQIDEALHAISGARWAVTGGRVSQPASGNSASSAASPARLQSG